MVLRGVDAGGLAGALVLCLGVMAAPPAGAVSFIACDATTAEGVLPNEGCTGIIDASNDSAAVMNTAPGAFGITDWAFIGRDNAQTETGDIDIFDDDTALITGTFSFDPTLVAGYETVALVLKGGAQAQPCGIVAYLLPTGATSGSYSSPFRCPAGQPEDISHLTLYGSLSSVRVPLPGALPLLLAGLAGLGLIARRRAV